MAIVVIDIYLEFKREFSKLIGFLVIALIVVGLMLGQRRAVRAIQPYHWSITSNRLWSCKLTHPSYESSGMEGMKEGDKMVRR